MKVVMTKFLICPGVECFGAPTAEKERVLLPVDMSNVSMQESRVSQIVMRTSTDRVFLNNNLNNLPTSFAGFVRIFLTKQRRV